MNSPEIETLLQQALVNDKYVERNIQALEVVAKKKTDLTAKQMKVYMFLVAMSYYTGNEPYYRLYWNRISIKEAADFLNISQPTWRNSIQKLRQLKYLYSSLEIEKKSYECLRIPTSYVPLGRQTILKLLKYCPSETGGFAITILGIFYRYWIYCDKNKMKCRITLPEITKMLYKNGHMDERLEVICLIEKLNCLKLIETKYYTATNPYNNKKYVGYELVKEPNLKAIEMTMINEELDMIMNDYIDSDKIAKITGISQEEIQEYLKRNNMLPENKVPDDAEDTDEEDSKYISKVYNGVCYIIDKDTGATIKEIKID